MIGEETWGMGRINKIYTGEPDTRIIRDNAGKDIHIGLKRPGPDDWRPTRVFFSDMIDGEIYPDIMVHFYEDYDVYCTSIVTRHLSGEYQPGRYGGHDWSMPRPRTVGDKPAYVEIPDKFHTYEYCTEHSGPSDGRPDSWRSDVAPDVYCRYGGTMQITLMHAVEEGYSPIYLVGVDLGFVPSLKEEGLNHFVGDYQAHDITQYKADGKNRAYAVAHGMARDYAEERGITIYNAGIGGQLEAYERVDFESLF